MILRNRHLWRKSIMVMMLVEEERRGGGFVNGVSPKFYSSSGNSGKMDVNKLKALIMERIKSNRPRYKKPLIPLAEDVLKARRILIQGVSTLLHFIPVWSCKHCSEVYIGEKGHLIRTCGGYMHDPINPKTLEHEWIKGNLDDIVVPVKTFHQGYMFRSTIQHKERSECDRVPAVVGLCLQAGAFQHDESQYLKHLSIDTPLSSFFVNASLSPDDRRLIACGTLTAWETLRSGVEKLLLAHPAKVCKKCKEVHVGPSRRKARVSGMSKSRSWCKDHLWTKAQVDDLVPPKVGWFQRCQDPLVLLDEGRAFYGHAPAVVNLCTKAGAFPPAKYPTMMKIQGLTAPILAKD